MLIFQVNTLLKIYKDAYEMSNLFPSDWNNLVDKMLADLNGPLVDKLYKYYTKSSDEASVCDQICRQDLLCGFKQARSLNYIKC